MARRSAQTVNPYITKRIRVFSGGQNDEHPATIGDNELVVAKNVEYTPEGRVRPRPGISKRFEEDFDSSPVLGMGAFYKTDGTTRLVMAAGTSLYVDTPHLIFDYDSQTDWQQSGVYTNLNTNPTKGTSLSGTNPSTDISSMTSPTFKIVVDGASTPQTITLSPSGLNTGAAIASAMQTAIRAKGGAYANVEVIYINSRYLVSSGTTGTSSAVVITAGDSNDVTTALKLGVSKGGTEATGTTGAITMNLPPVPTFSRSSVAYKSDGTQVGVNVPKYETGKFNQGILIEEGTTNLFTANQSSIETNTTGFTVSNSGSTTLSRDSGEHWTGSYSLKVVCAGSANNEGFYAKVSTASANTVYTASVYLKGSGTVTLRLYDVTNGVYQYSSTITLSSTWTRYSITLTTGASAVTDLRLYVITNSQQAITFYADGLQLEQKPYITSWILGGTTREGEVLSFNTSVLSPQQGTISFWLNVNDASKRQSTPFAYLFIVQGGVYGTAFRLIHYPTNSNWYWQSYDDSGSTTYCTVDDSYTPNGWHLFTATWDSSALKLYIDGVLRGSVSNSKLPSSLGNTAYIGHSYTNYNPSAVYDDFCISSRVRTDAEIAAYYASGVAHSWDIDTTYLLHFDNSLDYPTDRQGVWQGPVQNASTSTSFDSLSVSWQNTLITNTAITCQTRTSLDGTNWSAWYTQSNGETSTAPARPYSQMRFIFQEIGNAGTPVLSKATATYEGTPSVSTLLTGLSVASQYSFCQLADKLIICNGVDLPKMYDGTTISDISSAPRGWLCVTYRNRVWIAKTSENRSRLYCSGPITVDSWPSQNMWDVNPADGDEIMALVPLPTTLLVVKQHNAYFLQGQTPANFTFSHAGQSGTISQWGIIYTPYGAVTVDREGVWTTDFRTQAQISAPIRRKTWAGLNQGQFKNVAVFYCQDKLLVAVPNGTSNINNLVLMCDLSFRNHPWSVWTGWYPSCFLAYWERGRWDYLFGSSVSGNVYRIGGAENDAGNAFTAEIETKHYTLSSEEISNVLKWVEGIFGTEGISSDMSVSLVSNGVAGGEKSFTIPANSEEIAYRLYPSAGMEKTVGVNIKWQNASRSGAVFLGANMTYYPRTSRPIRVV